MIKKPEDWDKLERIPDLYATKPEDWDDEMNDEWKPFFSLFHKCNH